MLRACAGLLFAQGLLSGGGYRFNGGSVCVVAGQTVPIRGSTAAALKVQRLVAELNESREGARAADATSVKVTGSPRGRLGRRRAQPRLFNFIATFMSGARRRIALRMQI